MRHYELIAEKNWMQDGVLMCSKECCGQPVTECSCKASCKHCNCYKLNKMNEKKLKEKERQYEI